MLDVVPKVQNPSSIVLAAVLVNSADRLVQHHLHAELVLVPLKAFH